MSWVIERRHLGICFKAKRKRVDILESFIGSKVPEKNKSEIATNDQYK